MDEIVELDVGGTTEGFKVSRRLLCTVSGSALEAMFSGRHELPKVNGKIFVDRNPKVFIIVIDYLRNNLRLQKMIDEV